MNFFEGVITDGDGKLWFDEGTGRIAVPDWAKGALGSRVGSRLVMGVRPQAISAGPAGANENGCVLPMKVRVVEPLGDKMDVYLSTAKHPHVVARIDAHRALVPNQTISVHFDPHRLHFFEMGDPGAAIVTAPAPS
jgi:ABC-type sugar transport system ATPase subunit